MEHRCTLCHPVRGQRISNDFSLLSSILTPHPPPPLSPVSKLDGRHTGRLRNRGNLSWRDGERGGSGAESSDHKECLDLYKSFNILCPPLHRQGRWQVGLGQRINHSILQCCGSMTFWCGSGSMDPCLWLMDPDADPDPAIFIIDF